MTDVDALDKHACPACSAQAEWNAASQRLVCPFCGTESPYALNRQTGRVEEIDLVRALRELPEDRRGWHETRRAVRCQSCQAVMVFEPERVGQNCEFDELVSRERLLDIVWGWDYPVGIRAVDTRVAELRRALGDDPSEPSYIETVPSQGYRFVGTVESA